MAAHCEITGKHVVSGNNVSHANNKTKRKFYPNLQKKKFFLQELGVWLSLRVSTSAMRSIHKDGLYFTLKKALRRKTLTPRLTGLVKGL